MNRDEMITALSQNQACPFDEAALKGFSDEQLAFLSAQHKEEPKTDPKAEPAPADPSSAFKALETQLAALTSSLGNLDERIAKGVKAVLQADQKAELIASLKAHTDVGEEELAALSVEALERMAKAIVPATYQGRPLPRTYEPAPAKMPEFDRTGVVLKRVETKTA